MANRKPAGPATKSKNLQTLRVVIGAALCCAMLWGSATAQVVLNPVNGHFYEYVRIRGYVSWDQAQEAATARGGYLATVTDSLEAVFVAGILGVPGLKAFLGASDINDSCDWRWATGEPWNYTNWAPGEPSGEEPCENSLRTSYELGGKWEADVGTLDGWIVEWNTPQSDTLINLSQWPVSEGGNGHWYGLLPTTMNWVAASLAAAQIQRYGRIGHLATATSQGENDFIFYHVLLANDASTNHDCWLGGYFDGFSGTWKWVTQEPFEYTNWGGFSEPPNLSPSAFLAMSHPSVDGGGTPGLWNSSPLEAPYYSVVEFDTDPVDPLVKLRQWPVSEGGNGHWYAMMRTTSTWDQANHLASLFTQEGVTAHLATVSSEAENWFIVSEILSGDFGHTSTDSWAPQVWLGGYMSDGWSWVTGEPFFYSRFLDSAMTDTGSVVAMLAPTGEWDDTLAGYWVAREPQCDTFPFGCLSAVIEFDTEPNDTVLVLVEWSTSEGGNGHWYGLTSSAASWDDANFVASTMQKDGAAGHIATATSQVENEFILSRVIKPSRLTTQAFGSDFWLGGRNWGSWEWTTGEPFSYANWAEGYPLPIDSIAALTMYGSPVSDSCPGCPVLGQWRSRSPLCDIEVTGCLTAVIEFDTEPNGPRTLYVPEEFPTIQTAIDSARHGDLVLVSPGIYTESINFHGKNIRVRSLNGPLSTVITNERTVDLVRFQNGETHDAVLEGFTLQGGWIAVLISNSAPTIRRNICVGQNVWNWAAISISGPIDTIGDPTGDPRYYAHPGLAPAVIVNNTIVNSSNGGMYTWSTVPPTIRNNIVAFNANYGIAQQVSGDPGSPIVGYNDVYGQEENHGTPFGNYINIPDPGPGSISLDPLFDTRPFAVNWSLSVESPCIDAGDPSPRFNDPDSSRNDMGALYYQYQGDQVIPTNEWIVVYCNSLLATTAAPGPEPSVVTAYDPDGVLCGLSSIRQGGMRLMPIYRDDLYTLVDEGCEPGDLVQFKINGIPVQSDPVVYWTANGDVFEVCSFGQSRCVDIPLHTGWNLISWNVAFEMEIHTALDEIIGCVDVVQSFESGGLIFDPNLDGYNTLTHLDYRHAYWIRMNCDAVLQVCGDPIPDDEWIPLEPGWNMVSYWPDNPLPVETGFGSIIDSLQMAMGFDQGAQIWLPGVWLNTLTELRPTFGYWIKVSGFLPLYYPDFVDPDTILTAPENPGVAPLIETSREWMSVYGRDITVDGDPVADGAEFAFYAADDILCGRGAYTGGRLKLTPVYGWDESGELSKRFPKAGDGLAIRVDGQPVYPGLVWNGGSTRVRLSQLTTDSKGLPDSYALSQNYPNPFNPQTTIAYDIPSDGHVTLGIFNVLGQEVRTLVNAPMAAGRYQADWNGRDNDGREVSTGVYFYRLIVGETTLTRKMLLLK